MHASFGCTYVDRFLLPPSSPTEHVGLMQKYLGAHVEATCWNPISWNACIPRTRGFKQRRRPPEQPVANAGKGHVKAAENSEVNFALCVAHWISSSQEASANLLSLSMGS